MVETSAVKMTFLESRGRPPAPRLLSFRAIRSRRDLLGSRRVLAPALGGPGVQVADIVDDAAWAELHVGWAAACQAKLIQ